MIPLFPEPVGASCYSTSSLCYSNSRYFLYGKKSEKSPHRSRGRGLDGFLVEGKWLLVEGRPKRQMITERVGKPAGERRSL